jgi:hypothetical protein
MHVRLHHFLQCLFILVLTCRLAPAGADTFTQRQKTFIRELYLRQDYFACIAETRRLLHYAPGTADRDRYVYFTHGLYFLGGQYKTVIFNLAGPGPHEPGFPSLLLLSQAYLKLGLGSEGEKALSSIGYGDIEGPDGYELLIRRVEIHLLHSRFENAFAETERAQDVLVADRRIRDLKSDMAAWRDIPRRPPVTAALLSAVVPGAGQAWAGRYLDGAISLLAVAGLVTGTLIAHRNGERGVAMTFAFFSALTYGGAIYGAYNAAAAYNREQEGMFRARLMERHIPPYDPMRYFDIDRHLR